jgi:hypothetical protein
MELELGLGLLALRVEAQFLEKRISWIVGSIEKIGVVPGCLAVWSDCKNWVNNQYGSQLSQERISLFFILGTLANVYVMHYQRMIGLTELAIKQQELRDKTKSSGGVALPKVACAP